MSGIRFCSECLNILHPEEEKSEHRLLFICKSCDYREYIQDMTSMEENKIYQRDFLQAFTDTIIDPDYCLDPSMPREKVICPLCRYTECSYIIDREPNDKFLRKIYICGRVNKHGKPDCKNTFTAVKYQKLVSRGETYAYREFGASNNSNVLVMLHGNLSSSYVFERTFSRLGEVFRVIAPDLRGFGMSSFAAKFKTFDELAEDVGAFLGELKITSFCLLGWDIGASIALKYAAQNPGSLKKLVLANPVGLTGKTYIKDPYDESNPIPEWPDDVEDIAKDSRVVQFTNALKERKKDFFRNYYTDEIFTMKMPENDRLDSYIDHFMSQRNLVEIIYAMVNFDISENGTNEIYRVQTETLILCGTNDYKTPVDDAHEIQRTLGDISKIKEFEEVGHALMEDVLDDFVESIIEFCQIPEDEDEMS